MKNLAKSLCLLFSVLLCTSCQQIGNSIKDTFKDADRTTNENILGTKYGEDTNGLIKDSVALQTAENRFRSLTELKGKSIKVTGQLYIYGDGRIQVAVLDPDTAGNVNSYWYNASSQKWTKPTPVQQSAMDEQNTDKNSIPLDSLRFITAYHILKFWQKKADSLHSSSRLTALYYIPGSAQWYTGSIETSRASYSLYFNANGTLKSFARN